MKYCRFPTTINRLGIKSAYELQILVWAAMLTEGLKKSNNQLAELLFTDRRTVINAVNRLKDKKYVLNAGTQFNRILVANSEIVSLCNSEIVSPVNGEKLSQNSESLSTHNKKKEKTKKTAAMSEDDFQTTFDKTHCLYPGRKRGLAVEFQTFKKDVKDWMDVLPHLEPAVRVYIKHCEHLKATGQFCPNHKDFCRWLKNRCWETEYPDPMDGFSREADETEIDHLLGAAV